MPIFGHKFNTFRFHKRKSPHFLLQNEFSEILTEPIKIKLGSSEFAFIDGDWESVRGKGFPQENEYWKQSYIQLKEENNLLKTKIEILIDMLTEESFKSTGEKDPSF